MLVLTRKFGESIMIGNNVRITVLAPDGRGQIRLGIDAPPEVSVHRLNCKDTKPKPRSSPGRTWRP